MPICFCTVRGCRDSGGVHPSTGQPKGREVSARTYKSHQMDERAAAFAAAQEEAEDVLERELEQIAENLAATTLADEVTGSIQCPGGRLWGRSTEDADPDMPSSRQSHRSPANKINSQLPRSNPRRSQEDGILSCLAGIESLIHEFSNEAQPRLDSLKLPSANSPPPSFPLDDLLTRASELRAELENITYKGSAVTASKQSVSRKLDQLYDRLLSSQKDWNRALASLQQEHTPNHGPTYDSAHHYASVLENADPILQVAFFMILACQVILGMSRRGCTFLLNMVQYILHLTLTRSGQHLSLHDQKLLADIPKDFRSVDARFSLDSKHTIYAVCPNPDCHATYKPQYSDASPVPSYESYCTHKQFPNGKTCGTSLLRPRRVGGQTVRVPIKPFVAYSFKDWVAGLLSRPGFEEKMDQAWESNCTHDSELKDIFDGEILREFRGPDGQHFSAGGKEGRYAFSLCVDYFNPLGNKQAGKKKSVGMVSLVCLNLPPELRYKPENMFLYGVIPGPNEPPLDCLNHYLRYLVDDLEDFWDPGVQFTRTYKCYYGRVVRCAVVCVVCDLLAARKTVGFAAIKHTQMCAFCYCTRHSHGLGDTNVHTWRRRTNEEYRRDAERYANAQDIKDRKDVFTETGIRYSELLRLKYFDPSRFVVVDAMHNLFLGLIQEHFEILGMKLEETKEETIALHIPIESQQFESLSVKEQKSMRQLIKLLQSPLNETLSSAAERDALTKKIIGYHMNTLELACQLLDVELLHKTTRLYKADYAKALILWRKMQKENKPTPGFRRGCILTPAEVEEIRSDIERMTTPSWLTSIPSNLGEPSHGKLKADQWRTVGTMYLPISLVRLWDQEEGPSDRKKMLHATMSLISAVIIASSRSTSSAKADLYLQYMQAYMNGIRDLIPDYQFRPNHHAALHLPDYLRFFGPVHSWWTFPFERLIGLLQRIPTNFKPGELEGTISKTFVESANLRCLLMKDGCPMAIKHCQSHFTKLTDTKIRNSLLVDISTFLADPENDPPAETTRDIVIASASHAALRQHFETSLLPKMKPLSFVTIDGLTYSTLRRHHGNSSILVRRPSIQEPIPAEISDIIQTSNDDVLFVVQYYRQPAHRDPFRQYPHLHISLWKPEKGLFSILHPSDIISHFASVGFDYKGQKHIAVISLSREY